MARRTLADEDEGAAINLSPMIDCIFILLIFFIVTTVFVEEEGIQVNKPDATASASPEESENITLEITAQDKILFDGREIGLGDIARRVRNNVNGGEAPVMVRAHELSSHGVFVSVWDAARRGGAEKLTFSTYN
ncbi:MAG: biopolymer transporter ExbD [Myxococcota bacterium]|nr:biopolymer transporter ExbD [Myxococcota bacterium]